MNHLLAFEENGKWGYKDSNGNVAIKPQFEEAYDFSCGLGLVKVNNKYGYISEVGKFVVNPQFDDAFDFSSTYEGISIGKNLASVRDGDRNFLIGTTGQELSESEKRELKRKFWLKVNTERLMRRGIEQKGEQAESEQSKSSYVERLGKKVLNSHVPDIIVGAMAIKHFFDVVNKDDDKKRKEELKKIIGKPGKFYVE